MSEDVKRIDDIHRVYKQGRQDGLSVAINKIKGLEEKVNGRFRALRTELKRKSLKLKEEECEELNE